MRLSYCLPVVIVVMFCTTTAFAEEYVAVGWEELHIALAYTPPVVVEHVAPAWEPPVVPVKPEPVKPKPVPVKPKPKPVPKKIVPFVFPLPFAVDPNCADGQCSAPPAVGKPKKVLQTYQYGLFGRKKDVRWVTVQPGRKASSGG